MNRESRGVVVKGKFRVLKRTNTMHVSTNFHHSKSLMSRSGSSHSIASDPEDCSEGNEAISRRGRRSAIIDNLNIIGESSNSQSNSNPLKNDQTSKESESKINNIKETNVQSSIPSVNIIKEQQKKILKKQNTIADLTAKTSSVSSSTLSDDGRRKSAKSFLKLIDKKSKSKESMLDLQEALKTIKPSEFHDSLLMSYYDLHWTDLIPHSNKLETETLVPDMECRRRDAVWELFKSELVFLVDHLLVLKHCFMEPLKALQVEGHLMFIEPQDLYGNLDELCYVSYNFCRDFITALTKEATVLEFGTTDFLLRSFTKWSQHSKDGEVFHNYCINYECALTLLDILQKYEPFLEFERWCELDSRCHRLQLSDLLVAPMQHYTKMPLLLSCIRKYTIPVTEKQQLTTSLHKVENSLRNLEEKMRWLKNFERLQEIQSQLIWLPISEMEPRIFIPEFLKHSLLNQPCERLIANPKRTLMHEGYLFLNDSGKTVEVYGFLFDDFFLIAKIKKTPKKKSVSESNIQTRSPTDGALFIVYRQPIALDRFTIHDVGYVEANANGLRNAFVLVIMTRFQQIIGVYTLQSATDIMKNTWIEKLRIGQQQFQEKLKCKLQSDGYSQQTNKHSKLLNQIKSIQNCKGSSIYLSVETNPSSSPLSSRHGSLSTLITNASDMQLKIPCDILYDNVLSNSNSTSVPTTPEKIPNRPDDIQYTSLTPGSFSPPLSPTIHDFEIDMMGNLKPENCECLHLDLRRISQELFKDGIPEEDCFLLDSIDRNIPSTTTDLNTEMIE